MAAWRYSLVVSDPYTRLTKLNRTAQRSPDRYPRGYSAGQSAQYYRRSKSRVYIENSFRSRSLIMGTIDMWFVTKWLDQLVLANSEKKESDGKEKKRKRSDGRRSMASDSGYEEGGDGEYNISDIKRT